MITPIAGINSKGEEVDGAVVVAEENTIKNEIMHILKEHNLTIGKAQSVLERCKNDLYEIALASIYSGDGQ